MVGEGRGAARRKMIMDLNCPTCHGPPIKYRETEDGILLSDN